MYKLINLLSILFLLFVQTKTTYAQSAKRFFNDAKTSELNNNYEEAIDYYSKALLLDAKYYEAFLERGKCHEKLNHLSDALKDYKAMMDLKPDEIEPINMAASLLIRQKNYTEAANFYKKIIEKKKKNHESYLNLAYCYLNITEFKKVITECDKAIELEKNIPESYLYKAQANDSLNETNLAFENYTLGISTLEKNGDFKKRVDKSMYDVYYIGLANSQFKNNLFDLAIENYTKALTMNPKSFEALSLRGKTYAAKMKMKDAENDYNQAVVINDKNSDVFAGRAYVYYRLGEYEKAMLDYEKASLLNPNSAVAKKGKGLCFEALNNLDEAKKNYQLAYNLAKKIKQMN